MNLLGFALFVSFVSRNAMIRGYKLFSTRIPTKLSKFLVQRKRTTTAVNTFDNDISCWKEYFVEFRGILPYFRRNELQDLTETVIMEYFGLEAPVSLPPLPFKPVITDVISPIPVGIYTKLPNDDVARMISQRSASIRQIAEIWGDGTNVQVVADQAVAKFPSLISPVVNPTSRSAPTWKVTFGRYGRYGNSGYSDAGKAQLLRHFSPLLKQFAGKVSLQHAEMELLYYEDWTYYHEERLSLLKLNNINGEAELQPSRILFGRNLGNGPTFDNLHDLGQRPFVGPTTMKPVPALLAVQAAKLSPGQTVLDPFSGTGSILIAAASQGCLVVGSDIEGNSMAKNAKAFPEDNNNNKNESVLSSAGPLNGCVLKNFECYGLQQYVQTLLSLDAAQWTDSHTLPQYLQLDGIVSDPPFGRRERFIQSHTVATNSFSQAMLQQYMQLLPEDVVDIAPEDAFGAILVLFRMAELRLKPGKRLVFFVPTKALVKAEQMEALMQGLYQFSTNNTDAVSSLKFVRVAQEELSDNLWRWLCVFEKNAS